MRDGGNSFSRYGRARGFERQSDADFRRVVDDARARCNLSDIVGRYTTLKKRGGKELVGICPFHSERSPSFEVNDGKGTYHCWGCGAGGDAFSFLMNKEGLTFRQALEALTGNSFPEVSQEERARRKDADEKDVADRMALARSIWSSSVPPQGTPAQIYLQSRGIDIAPPETVRFVMTPRYRNADTGEVGRDHPAMVCALQDVTGAIVGVQCVFLQDGGRRKYVRVRSDGTKAKAKLTFGVVIGSAFRIGPPAPHVILCEGPEDGLTLAMQLEGKSIWVACGTEMLGRVGMPPEVQGVTLAGDNGDAGHAAVEKARTAYLDIGLRVGEAFPDAGFKDWNDQLRGIRA